MTLSSHGSANHVMLHFAEGLESEGDPELGRHSVPSVYAKVALMRTPSANTKCRSDLDSVIAATKKLWRQHHLSYDQCRYVSKEVRRALQIERPTTRQRVVARLSREEERRLIAHAYRMKGVRGLLIKTLFQTGARVSEFVNIKVERSRHQR